jgi:hypothetical protein
VTETDRYAETVERYDADSVSVGWGPVADPQREGAGVTGEEERWAAPAAA